MITAVLEAAYQKFDGGIVMGCNQWVKMGKGGSYAGFQKGRETAEPSAKQEEHRKRFGEAAKQCAGSGDREKFTACISEKMKGQRE